VLRSCTGFGAGDQMGFAAWSIHNTVILGYRPVTYETPA